MHLKWIKLAALLACAVMAACLSLAGPAQAASSATTQPSVNTSDCAWAVAELHFYYWSPPTFSYLAWSSEGAKSGYPVMLGYQKSTSPLDCFKQIGDVGPEEFVLQQYSPTGEGLCLNVAGNSHTAGAWIILYQCGAPYPVNEKFKIIATAYGEQLQGVSSGLCADVKNGGLQPYSKLEQEPCGDPGDAYQEWGPFTN